MSEQLDAGEPESGERLTARDAVIGAAHVAQLAETGGPAAHTAVKAVGVADTAKIAAAIVRDEKVRAMDVASAAASVAMTAGMGSAPGQGGARAVAAASALDALRRALNSYHSVANAPAALDVEDRKAIERRNDETLAVPRNALDEQAAREMARADTLSLHEIEGPRERQHAAIAMGHTAASQSSYKAELTRQDPYTAEVVEVAFATEQQMIAVKEDRKAAEMKTSTAPPHSQREAPMTVDDATLDRLAAIRNRDSEAARKDLSARSGDGEVSERFVQQLDERMAKSELEEKGWRDRGDLADVMRDLETLAAKDWQRAATLWDKYRPDDADRPIFIDGGDKDPKATRGPREADNTVERERPKSTGRDGSEGDEKEFVTPESLRKRFLQAENKFYFRDDENRLAFEDKGKRLATDHNDPEIARSMVELAEAKGWESIKIKGAEEFKREVWLQASVRGMEVQGFRPRDVDLAKLADLRKEQVKTADKAPNSIEPTPERTRAAERPEGRSAVDRSAVVDEHQRTLSDQQRQARDALKDLLRARGDSEKAVNMAADLAAERFQNNRVHVGKIVEHGQAPYEHDPKNSDSYYVKLQTAAGEKTLWGVDLRRAIGQGKADVGDDVALAYQGRQQVTVKVKERDANGKVAGESDLVTNRNAWDVNKLDSLRDEVKQRLNEAARKSERQPLMKVYDRDAQRVEPRPEVVRKHVRRTERTRG